MKIVVSNRCLPIWVLNAGHWKTLSKKALKPAFKRDCQRRMKSGSSATLVEIFMPVDSLPSAWVVQILLDHTSGVSASSGDLHDLRQHHYSVKSMPMISPSRSRSRAAVKQGLPGCGSTSVMTFTDRKLIFKNRSDSFGFELFRVTLGFSAHY